jgi:Domain of unknown function (DUF3303)
MLYVTHYEAIGEPSKARAQELMALFGERGSGEGTLAHYVYADAGAGFVISDESGLDSLYEDAIQYGPYLKFTTRPILTVDEAVPTIAAWMSS